MSRSSPRDLKKALVARGFQVFRTLEDRVVLAERVRENLIMDSGVSARLEPLSVCVAVHARASDFPGEPDAKLFERARAAGRELQSCGYRESGTRVVPTDDPGKPGTVLDTTYEVHFERLVADDDELASELERALEIQRNSGG